MSMGKNVHGILEFRRFGAGGYWNMSFKQLGKNTGAIRWPQTLILGEEKQKSAQEVTEAT